MDHNHRIRRKISFYAIKLPFILTTIVIGFALEFLIELPLMVMCRLDGLFGVHRYKSASQVK